MKSLTQNVLVLWYIYLHCSFISLFQLHVRPGICEAYFVCFLCIFNNYHSLKQILLTLLLLTIPSSRADSVNLPSITKMSRLNHPKAGKIMNISFKASNTPFSLLSKSFHFVCNFTLLSVVFNAIFYSTAYCYCSGG